MHRISCAFVLVLILGLVPAMADVQAVGPQLGDWGQAFNDPETGVYDTLIVQLIGGPGGPLMSPTGALTNLTNGWVETFDNGTIATAQGTPTLNESWTFNFVPVDPGDVSMEFWALSGGTVIDTGILGYGTMPTGSADAGSGWWWIQQGNNVPVPSVPEPGAVSLLLTMLGSVFGLAGVFRKKLG